MNAKKKNSENSQESRRVQAGQDYFEQVGGNVYTGPVYMQGQAGQEAETTRPKVSHNLPQPDYDRFVGRKAELEHIQLLLSPKHRSWIITIDGIGGIGKSALALEIAHRYLHNYDQLEPEDCFDAIIWMSAKQTVLTAEGISTRRRILHTLNDIYTAIAVALQREDITRASAETQDEVVRNALTRQRTLLIVDNLETIDDEAVLDFLRELPDPTKAIVTTRHRIDVAYPIRLTGMPWEDAKQLIEQECEKKGVTLDPGSAGVSPAPANDEQAGRLRSQAAPANDKQAGRLRSQENTRHLYDRTGGVPLAIVWSIAQMGFGYSVEAVLTRLGQPTGDIAKFCFEGAIARIKNKPAHKLLIVLSLCADSSSREALGYATELPELDRDDGLVELEKLSLVNKKGDRFWLLPLTKQFAAAEFQQSADKEQLRGKWVEYFSTLSKVYSGEQWGWKNYDWLLVEGNNILSIVDWALNNNQEKIALSFTHATQRYLEVNGRWGELLVYGEQLHTIAQSLNDKQTWAWICLHWLSLLLLNQGNINRAEILAKQSLSVYQKLNDVRGMCFAMQHLGRIQRVLAKYETAEALYKQAMNLAQEHNYGDEIAFIHLEISHLLRYQGKWEESKKHCEAAINWYEKHKDESEPGIKFLMEGIGHLGWIEFHLNNYHHGKELLEKSLASLEHTGGKGHNTRLHLRLAIIENTLGNRKEALEHVQEALFWAERLDMKRELEGAQKLLQELHAEPKQPEKIEDEESA